MIKYLNDVQINKKEESIQNKETEKKLELNQNCLSSILNNTNSFDLKSNESSKIWNILGENNKELENMVKENDDQKRNIEELLKSVDLNNDLLKQYKDEIFTLKKENESYNKLVNK